MPEPDYHLPPPTHAQKWVPAPGGTLHRHTGIGSATSESSAVTQERTVGFESTESKLALPFFNRWHFLRDLPEAYQKDVRTKVADRTQCAPWEEGLQALFVRQGTFTLCALRSLAGFDPADVEPVAYGMAKRNMRIGTRPGKGPERESPQVGQRAALGRAVDAWLRDRLAWSRPVQRKG